MGYVVYEIIRKMQILEIFKKLIHLFIVYEYNECVFGILCLKIYALVIE